MSNLRILGYVRCSLAEQHTDGLSLAAQSSRIVNWCEATGAELVGIASDAGVSGTKPLAQRPAGARVHALVGARNPSVDAVAVVRLDRLGRDAAETLAYLRGFARGSVGLVSIVDRVDLSSPQGRAMAQLGAVFAELERALIGQRTSEALAALRSSGRLYGPVPYGFHAAKGCLVEAAEEQAVLRRITTLRARGLSYRRIAELLNGDGVPAKRGGVWFPMSVRSVTLTSAAVPEVEAA